jgi:Glycosyl transferases group 1/Glycosyltransferase Family 4
MSGQNGRVTHEPSRQGTPRLLIVCETRLGGMAAAVAGQAAWFTDHSWEVTVAAPGRPPTVGGIHHVDLSIPTTTRSAREMLDAARTLRAIIRRIRPTAVHAHGARAFAVTSASLTGRHHVTLHGTGSSASDPTGWGLTRRLGVAMMPLVARAAITVAPGTPGSWEFLPHASPRLAEIEESDLPVGPTPTFLWVAALDPRKRPDLFVMAVAEASRTRPVRGMMAGGGPLTPAIEGLIRSTRADITMVGETSDIAELIRGSTALALFSGHEGVPFALEEGMWGGRTFIATPHPGVTWLGGDAGWYATTIEQIATAMVALSDRAVAQASGRAAAHRVRTLIAPSDPWPAIEAILRAGR